MIDLTRRGVLGAIPAQASVHRSVSAGLRRRNPSAHRALDSTRSCGGRANSPRHSTQRRCSPTACKLDFDAWRDIRFRPDRALTKTPGSNFRLQTFHLGFLYNRPVTVNTIRDGIATPIPYAANLFDYGRTKFDKPLPVNPGFAGFRLHYPINDPRVFDEVIAFLGASYFRFLGRNQNYGLSARGVCIDAGSDHEDFPFFREFWIEAPESRVDRVTIYALLDCEAMTGAYHFELYPARKAYSRFQSTSSRASPASSSDWRR